MNENQKINSEHNDELSGKLETGNDVNTVIKQQGEDAAAGITLGADAARYVQDHQEQAGNEADENKD
ncbi:hypothetical protein EOD41_10065 [Mucilaginibacter limnophilus]|uniref:Uncharacterized protein n=1 Tax=Mucilaginibacter limnophilus TaxID=1932778 RepID=A0A437MTH8_9SPHI|nr:hypothetical protein [Mucilaginibacter limnophilus]RVU00967.1 hypothetical protein EOD41_10065 [Mucilaginibacter limnophilus]